MTGSRHKLDITLARDVAAKKFSWLLLPGRSMTFVKFESSFVPQGWTPQKSTDKLTQAWSPLPSAFWHPRGGPVLRPTMNHHMQTYFRIVQRLMPRTCHPSTIHHEALLVTHSVSAGLASQAKLSGEAVAIALFRAGTARSEYSRTVALLIHDVLVELNLSDWRSMRTLQVNLENLATSSIVQAWFHFSLEHTTGLERSADLLEPIPDERFNAAAFYGDLVAIGAIPCSLLDAVVNGFLDCLTSTSQCRFLYLLLIRATFRIATPIQPDYLLGWRTRLLFPRPVKLSMDDEMVQRWIIELCNVIDKALAQLAENINPPGVKHTWDPKLTRQGLHHLLEKAGEVRT